MCEIGENEMKTLDFSVKGEIKVERKSLF